jgi:hypothetical protein
MLVILIDIFISVRIRKQAVVQPIQLHRDLLNMKRQKTFQKQMFILMFTSICIFLITSLPFGIYKIISPRQADLLVDVYQVIIVWTAVEWFQTLFYAVSVSIN